ncbi:MAG TPA: DNA replication complex GINS family protein [Hadesarchaea archaeon]|nr:DNA replication complex GINS family protein [Hadesarchaea archaeon]
MKMNVRILKEVPEIKLVRRQLGPLAVGDEAEMWVWDAVALERHGIAEPVQKLTPPELRKLILAEERSSGLTSLSSNFYQSVARGISTLQTMGKFEKASELKDQALTLVEIRLPKLLRLALSPEVPSGLPPEEHFLINRLADMVENWSKRLSDSFENTGEEVGKHGLGKSVQHIAGDETDIQKQRVFTSELHTGGTAPQG